MKGRQAAFEEAIQEAPVIAAVKNDTGLAHALRSECAAVFILYGTILDIGQIVKRIKAAGKLAFVHADLIEGLSNRGEIAVDFLAEATKADVIDILPGAMPDVIRRLSQRVTQPLIASGLLTDKRDVCGALAAGAVAVSTTSEELWEA